MSQLGVDFNRTFIVGIPLGWYTFCLGTIQEIGGKCNKNLLNKKIFFQKVVFFFIKSLFQSKNYAFTHGYYTTTMRPLYDHHITAIKMHYLLQISSIFPAYLVYISYISRIYLVFISYFRYEINM